MTIFAALGDSITLGVGDPVREPGQRMTWRGWAALLAEGLCEPTLHILAGNGALAVDIESVQLPRALELRPDLASVVFGVNDTLRSNFDPDRIAAAATHTIGALRASGAEVLTMRLPDPGRMFGLPSALARPLSRRMHAVNTELDKVAARYGTLHWDATRDPETYDRRNWSVDRLHPNERGHRLIACRFWDRLAEAGHELTDKPDPEPTSEPPTRRDDFIWMATKGTKWFLRRSVDLIPYLLFMAAREWLFVSKDWMTAEAEWLPAVAEAAAAEPVPE